MPRLLVGAEQHYDWGDTSSIRTALGAAPADRPVAELWWGTHPMAPSRVDDANGPLLSDVVGEMTMLVKLLACERPLSLQTHPSASQARRGFDREDAAGIARDAAHRMYRDPSDKPEILVAMSPFEALCGFRPVDESVSLLESIGWNEESEVLDQAGIDGYVLWAFDQPDAPGLSTAPDWLRRIATVHPGDRGLRVAPLLHHVVLQPGEAVSLPAGNLHAYLHGFGLEVMKSSDNVVRAGFTSKHVDVAELQRIMDTTPLDRPVVLPGPDGGYACPTDAFAVAHMHRAAGSMLPPSSDVRIVYGRLHGVHHSAVVVPAGESMTFDASASDVWVCTQHDA